MVGLLGRHGEVVEEILSRLQRLRDGDVDEPRAVVLVAESGAGKSRIVPEVYDRLRAEQPAPGYWPALADIDRSLDAPGADPMPARKVLGPRAESLVWRPNAVPSFGWWAFECERMGSGAAVDVVAAAYPQLEAPQVLCRSHTGCGSRSRAA